MFIVDYDEVWPSFHETVEDSVVPNVENICQQIYFKGAFNFVSTFK